MAFNSSSMGTEVCITRGGERGWGGGDARGILVGPRADLQEALGANRLLAAHRPVETPGIILRRCEGRVARSARVPAQRGGPGALEEMGWRD